MKKENKVIIGEYLILSILFVLTILNLLIGIGIKKNTELLNNKIIYIQNSNVEDSRNENIADKEDNLEADLTPPISEEDINISEITTEERSAVDKSSMGVSTIKFEIGESVPLPSLPTNIKTFTDYRCYNLWYSPHYRLQQASYSDEYGLRKFNDDYIVAMGAFYTTNIGDRFRVTLDNGNVFTVILGDGKAPIDCDETNMYAPCVDYNGERCANVLEFIIDSDILSNEVYSRGSIDCLDVFSGNIIRMEYLGRDKSADWDTYEVAK